MQQEPLFLELGPHCEIHDGAAIVGRSHRETRFRVKECPVCLGLHEEQIHNATLSVRQWFRGEVTKSFGVVFFE